MQDIIARALGAKANKKIEHIGTALIYKGVVSDYDHLPGNASNGDVYVTQDDGKSYAYGDNGWDELGTDIDMTAYLLKSELVDTIGDSRTTTMTQAAITSNFNKLFVQNDQPINANEGDVWINPSADSGPLPSFEDEEF